MLDELYIVLDESGAMRDRNDYFIIGGYITNNLVQIKSRCKKIEQKIRNEHINYYGDSKEIKGVNIKAKDIGWYLGYIFEKTHSLTPVSIIINKKELRKEKWHENSAFNYFTKCLIRYLIQKKALNYSVRKINIFIDNRNTGVIFQHDLETHLNLEFLKEKIIFKVSYKNSFESQEVRLADLISYSIFQHFNRNTKRAFKFRLSLKNWNYKLHEVQCYFPWLNNWQ